MLNEYRESFKIRAYEIDSYGRAGIQTISNYMQEAAGNHATELGVGVEKLFEKGLTWVLSRLHIRMNRFPQWRQTVTLHTWPAKMEGLFALRDFRFFDEKGRELGVASTSWMLMDLTKRKAVPMPDFIASIARPDAPPVIPNAFQKLPTFTDQDNNHERWFNVRLSDLDINRHVNNVSFIEWALEAVPVEVQKSHHLAQLEINFRAESRFGDRIQSRALLMDKTERTTFIHSLCREKDQREVAAAVSVWQPQGKQQ